MHVFPGGALDAHDEDPEWEKVIPDWRFEESLENRKKSSFDSSFALIVCHC